MKGSRGACGRGRISKAVIRKVAPIVVAELFRKGGKSHWAGKSPRQAYGAMLNKAEAAERLPSRLG
jgi:hypothetical protein